MKREYSENIVKELVYFCDCNNNLVEQVSQTGANDSETTNGGIFVDDPVVAGSKCIRKREGNYYLPVFIFNTMERRSDMQDRYRRFVDCETESHNDSTYYSYILGHTIEFDYMPNSFATSKYPEGSIIDYCGMSNLNANAKYPGFSLCRRNKDSSIWVAYKNSNKASGFQYHELYQCTLGRWYRVRMSFYEAGDAEYNAFISCEDVESHEVKEYQTINFMRGVQNTNNRARFDFFCDSWGYGSWCQNTFDYIKNVKVYKN